MREYFRYFKWVYVLIALLACILFLINGAHRMKSMAGQKSRTNAECATTQRVFDYADVLSNREEEKLAELIAKREKQTNCDIILITLNESLKAYAREIDPQVPYDEFVRVFAEQFYEKNGFGYDKPNGDGVLLVDNWFREDDGRIYTWFCTTGSVQNAYSDADIDHILDRVYRYVETNPYRAYKTYVNDFYHDMAGGSLFHVNVPGWLAPLAGLVAALGFVAVNWKPRSGKNTTTAVTYVNGRNAKFPVSQDIFLRKTVVKHRIERSSSHGGGGGHSGGGGGGSHGGGGHSR